MKPLKGKGSVLGKDSEYKLIRYGHAVKRDWRLYLLLLPMIAWYLLWMYKPMAGLLMAFKNYQPNLGVLGSDWVGFTNFKSLMFGPYSEQFWRAFRSTFLISLYGLVFGFPVPIILAIMFSELGNKVYRNVAQTFTYLPHFLSEVTITGLVLTLLYHGEVNTGVIANLLFKLNIVPEGTKMFQSAAYFRPLFIITGIWKESGYNSIV